VARRLPFLLLAVATVVLGLAARPAAAANDPEITSQWGLNDIKAPQAWAKSTGGVGVGIVSSGVAAGHPDLAGKVDGSSGGAAATVDNGNRGTHLAGIVGAAKNNTGIVGVAPAARILPYKAFESESAGINLTVFLHALDQARADRPQVVLVDVPDTFPGDAASKNALRSSLSGLGGAGISVVVGANPFITFSDLPVLVVAAANSGGGQVGSVGVNGKGVAAPGGGVHSTTVTPAVLPTDPPYTYSYGDQSGTGQAAAHVAGALAILRRLGANAGQAADLLRNTARKSGNAAFGAGIIDVAAAVAAYTAPATTTTTAKKAAPAAGNGAGGTLPPKQLLPSGTGGGLAGDPLEPGVGGTAVSPPGVDQFVDSQTEGGPIKTTSGQDRPLGALAVGFGMLFGVGSGLTVTFRRLAAAGL